MSTITGGELLARCLANEGVKFVFGLPCAEIDPLLAQLAAHDIRLVPVRHEAAGVHMAEGLYKTTGQVAVVLGNPRPRLRQSPARSDHGTPRGRSRPGDHVAAPARHR